MSRDFKNLRILGKDLRKQTKEVGYKNKEKGRNVRRGWVSSIRQKNSERLPLGQVPT